MILQSENKLLQSYNKLSMYSFVVLIINSHFLKINNLESLHITEMLKKQKK